MALSGPTRGERAPPGGMRVFIARLTVSRTTVNGRAYVAYRLTVPREVVDALGAREGDYLVVVTKRAGWYHLVKWDGGALDDPGLSGEIRRDVRRLREIEESGAL
mgnify:CR=1 FL=1